MSQSNLKEFVNQILDGSLISKYQQKLKDSLPKPKTFEEVWLEKGYYEFMLVRIKLHPLLK